MRAASRIGSVFGMDPVRVLAEKVTLHRQVREAALKVYWNDQSQLVGGDD